MRKTNDRIKVLHLIDTLSMGGAEQSLVSNISRFTVAESVVCHLYPGDQLKARFESLGVLVVSLNLPGRYSFRRANDQFRSLLRDTKPDLVHSSLLRSNLVARFSGITTSVPVLNSLVNESYAPVRLNRLSGSLRAKFCVVKLIDRLTSDLAYHYVANSKTIKNANSKALGIHPERISVIYRGRDPHQFTVSETTVAARLRRELGFYDYTPVLLNVGRLVLAKNQAELIRAMPTVLREFPRSQLLIAGEGPERRALEETISELGLSASVHLLGNRSDIPELLQIADVFVFPSLYEGHPGALVEAMFASLAIVASDIPVHRETLLDGAVGDLAPLGNPAAFATRVVALLRNGAHAGNLGACARQSALQRFDISHIAAQHEQLYQTLVDRWRVSH